MEMYTETLSMLKIGFIVFTIMIIAITSVITTKVKRKRKFRRKW